MASTRHITIGYPILTGSDHFIVKYRLVGSSSWAAVSPNPTNAPFDIPALDDGDYELSINVSTAPDDPAIISCFSVTSDCLCPEIYNEQLTSTSGVKNISFDLNLSNSFPPCGMQIVLTGLSGAITTVLVPNILSLTHIVASPFVANQYQFNAVVTESQYTIQVYIDCCTGDNGVANLKLCDIFSIILADPPSPCINATFRQSAITAAYDSATGNYYLYAYGKFPTPCDTVIATYLEGYFVTGSPDGGTVFVSGINALIPDSFGYKALKIQVHPNPTDTALQYHLRITDCCGVTHYLS